MSDTWKKVLQLIASDDYVISAHGYDELAADDIFFSGVLESIGSARVVEDYPAFAKGPCVLVRQEIAKTGPIHVVWGIPAGADRPAVLVTAYRPDPARWSDNFMRRKKP